MERTTNHAREASTDERASSSPRGVAANDLDFEPVPLRYRSDGWTPERQVAFVEALADTGVIRKAAAMVGMTEQSVSRLRRRPEARRFHVMCETAQRAGARHRIVATAYDRAIEGIVKARYYRGERVGEERVYDNRLLTYLLGKVAPLVEPSLDSLHAERHWDAWPGPEAAASSVLRCFG